MKNTVHLHDKTFEPYISAAELNVAVRRVAEQIYEKHKEQTVIFLGVLNGAFMFVSDLAKAYPGDCEFGFVRYASYEGTSSTGVVKKLVGVDQEWIRDRVVVLVEDIVDTGNTFYRMMNDLEGNGPASVEMATLFFKPEAYTKDRPIDYVAMEIPNAFIVGYGLDYDGLGRNLPEVYKIVE